MSEAEAEVGARIISAAVRHFAAATAEQTALDDGDRYAADVERKISQRIDELKADGPGSHGPQRHLEVNDQQLQARLGTPLLNPDGTPKLNEEGFVRTTAKIDPMTGTTTDAVTGVSHRCAPIASRFDSPADFAYVDSVVRARADASGAGAQAPSIESLLGDDGHTNMTGYYVDPTDPANYRRVNFKDGIITAIYKFDNRGKPFLYTMHPNPAPNFTLNTRRDSAEPDCKRLHSRHAQH